MHTLGVMGELHGGGGRPGEDDVVVGGGGGSGGGDDLVPESASASLGSSVSSVSLCSSTMSSLTDDDAESSPAVGDGRLSSPSPGEDAMQLDGEGDGGGPLYELSPLLAHLPVRTGLSKYYKGKSQSFTSLSGVNCLQDLAKKTRIIRIKPSPSILHHVRGPCSKMIAKRTILRGSSDQLLPRGRSRGALAQKRQTTFVPET